jgi:hypothetical protein
MRFATTALLTLICSTAFAKLPPPSDETKAKAAEAAARSAWADKVGAYKLCLVVDKVAAQYQARVKTVATAPSPAASAVQTPPCADPGPFVAQVAKPLEAAGAHSPPATAVSPPSSKATDAEIKGGIKK